MVKKGFLTVFVLLCLFVLPALVSAEVLWNQELSVLNTQAYYSQDYTEIGLSDMWLADDFVVTEDWNISTIFVPGDFRTPAANTFLNAESLNWEIYGNTAMKPDGDPSGRGNPPLWSLSLPPDDPQVVRTIGTGGEYSDVTLNLTTPVSLDPGTYWLVFYPKMASTYGIYGRQPSLTTTPDSFIAKFVEPAGTNFPTATEWTSVLQVPWPADKFPIELNPQHNYNFAFRLEGTIGGIPTPTTLSNPENIVAAGSVLLYADFGSDGLWLWDSAEWTPIAKGNPKQWRQQERSYTRISGQMASGSIRPLAVHGVRLTGVIPRTWRCQLRSCSGISEQTASGRMTAHGVRFPGVTRRQWRQQERSCTGISA